MSTLTFAAETATDLCATCASEVCDRQNAPYPLKACDTYEEYVDPCTACGDHWPRACRMCPEHPLY